MLTKIQLREVALDAFTTPGVRITKVAPKRTMDQIRKEAAAKRQAEYIEARLRKEVA